MPVFTFKAHIILNLLTSIKFVANPNTWKKMKRIMGWEILYNSLTCSCAMCSIGLVPSSGSGTQQNSGESHLYRRPDIYSLERAHAQEKIFGEISFLWQRCLVAREPMRLNTKDTWYQSKRKEFGLRAKNEIMGVVKNNTPAKVETPSDWTHIGPSFTPIKEEICRIKHRTKAKKTDSVR